MSGPHLHQVGKVWHYHFQVNGKRVQRSSRETIKKRAQEIADKAYEEAKLWAQGKSAIPTLGELADIWISAYENVHSKPYIKTMRLFRKNHLYELRELLVSEITTDLVEESRKELLKAHARATANHWLSLLNVLGNYAIRRRMIPRRPWDVKPLRVQKKPRVTLPAPTAQQWLAAIDAATTLPGKRTAMRLMVGLGLRGLEVRTARWEWMDWDRKAYTPGITKGKEADALPMADWLIAYLQPLRQGAGLIVTRPDGQAYGEGFCTQVMRAANEACGIGNLTPHRLRGNFATLMSEAGVPAQVVQRMMRHKDIKTTMAYLEVNHEFGARGHARVAERLGFDVPRGTSA